jgi:hypothetical protein
MVMASTLKSNVSPEVLRENMLTIHQFLRESYTHAAQHWQHAVSFFKDEFSDFHKRTRKHINRSLAPVNDFLKDSSLIENEMQSEKKKDPKQHVLLEGRMVHANEVLKGPLEENY